jgi:hypothetical protein
MPNLTNTFNMSSTLRRVALFMLVSMAMCAQPAFHTLASDKTIDFLLSEGFTPLVAYPLGGIASHMASDELIGEAGLGDFQIDIAGIRELIMYVNTPDDKKQDFLAKAFWGLFPDIWDKGLNRNDFHRSGRLASAWSKDGTELLEELAVLYYTLRF